MYARKVYYNSGEKVVITAYILIIVKRKASVFGRNAYKLYEQMKTMIAHNNENNSGQIL